jgi:hypothetical protein
MFFEKSKNVICKTVKKDKMLGIKTSINNEIT